MNARKWIPRLNVYSTVYFREADDTYGQAIQRIAKSSWTFTLKMDTSD